MKVMVVNDAVVPVSHIRSTRWRRCQSRPQRSFRRHRCLSSRSKSWSRSLCQPSPCWNTRSTTMCTGVRVHAIYNTRSTTMCTGVTIHVIHNTRSTTMCTGVRVHVIFNTRSTTMCSGVEMKISTCFPRNKNNNHINTAVHNIMKTFSVKFQRCVAEL